MVSHLESTCCSMIRAKRRRRKTKEWIRDSNLKYLLRKPHEKNFSFEFIHYHSLHLLKTYTNDQNLFVAETCIWFVLEFKKENLFENNGPEKFSDSSHEASSNSLQSCSFSCENRKPFWKFILYSFEKSGINFFEVLSRDL